MTDFDRDEGMAIRREVMGDAYVDRAEANKTDFTADFQDFVARVAWGGVWNRPGLDRRTRSVATIAAAVALRAEGELRLHVRGALRNGLTPDEIKEVILHTAAYAGIPAANDAFRVAQEVIDEDV